MLEQLPRELRGALLAAPIGSRGASLEPFASDGSVRRWGDGQVVVDLALDDEGRQRVLAEVAGRAWAAQAGVPTPRVLAAAPQGQWLLAQAAPAPGGLDGDRLQEALRLALRVEQGPPAPTGPSRTWRAPRRGRLARTARLVQAGVPLPAFASARAAAAGLPCDGVAHGDYHPGNLLGGGPGGVQVVDWEFLGPAPRGTDAARLWATLPDAGARARLLGLLRDVYPLPRLRVLVGWAALLALAEAAHAEPEDRAQDLRRARQVRRDAVAFARTAQGGD